MKTKLSVSGIGLGIILILIGIFESNFLSSDVQKFFSGSNRETALWLLTGGTVIVSAAVLAFARAVTD
jgi:hypothetical protein